ncbi:hypothetical protein GCM10020331_064800 [Ectobacillus funiculus]
MLPIGKIEVNTCPRKKRIEQIKELLHAHNEISLEDIMEKFQVSRDTARRDLVKLEEDGDIVRVKKEVLFSPQNILTYLVIRREISLKKKRTYCPNSLFIDS